MRGDGYVFFQRVFSSVSQLLSMMLSHKFFLVLTTNRQISKKVLHFVERLLPECLNNKKDPSDDCFPGQ